MSAIDPLKEFEMVMLAEHHESEHEFCRIIHDHLIKKGSSGELSPTVAKTYAALLDEYVQLMAHHFTLAQYYWGHVRAARQTNLIDRLPS